MKKEYKILLVFLGIIAFSGVMIYLVQAPNPTTAPSHDHETMTESAPPTASGQMSPDAAKARIKEQITAMESDLKNDPQNYELLVALGNANYDVDEPVKAIDYYERALKIKPSDSGVIVDLGAMYRQTGDSDKAVELFNKAISIDPKLPQAYFNLGMVLRMEKNDPVGAAKAWQKYLELDPNSEAKEFLEGEIKSALGNG